MGKFGVEQVRGSSSRRGPQALLELSGRGKLGYDLAVTPDGPRGPRYVVQKGVIALAQVTGLPIIPVTCNTRRKICLKSWDGFQIPLPFSRCELILNEAIHVPREACEVKREALRLELEGSLRGSSEDLTGSERGLLPLLANRSQGPVADELLALLVPQTKRE
jgi:lysophospholipid acyltransferase (LPLAT)-like uncharacterized protein